MKLFQKRALETLKNRMPSATKAVLDELAILVVYRMTEGCSFEKAVNRTIALYYAK